MVAARIASGASVSDFLAFYTAGHLVRTGDGVHVYDPAVIESAERLIYHGRLDQPVAYPLPVFASWLFAPISALSFTAAYLVYACLTAALLAGLLWMLNRGSATYPGASVGSSWPARRSRCRR